jgi:hypothetical protein
MAVMGLVLTALGAAVTWTTPLDDAAFPAVLLSVWVAVLATLASLMIVHRVAASSAPASTAAMAQLGLSMLRVAVMAGGAAWIVAATGTDWRVVAVTMAGAYVVLLGVESVLAAGMVRRSADAANPARPPAQAPSS